MILIELINFVCTGSLLLCTGFLQLQQVGATCHCNAKASHCGGFSGCWAQALGTQASVDGGSLLGLVALVVGGILLDQGSNPSPCIGRPILIHCTTREIPILLFLKIYFFDFVGS